MAGETGVTSGTIRQNLLRHRTSRIRPNRARGSESRLDVELIQTWQPGPRGPPVQLILRIWFAAATLIDEVPYRTESGRSSVDTFGNRTRTTHPSGSPGPIASDPRRSTSTRVRAIWRPRPVLRSGWK